MPTWRINRFYTEFIKWNQLLQKQFVNQIAMRLCLNMNELVGITHRHVFAQCEYIGSFCLCSVFAKVAALEINHCWVWITITNDQIKIEVSICQPDFCKQLVYNSTCPSSNSIDSLKLRITNKVPNKFLYKNWIYLILNMHSTLPMFHPFPFSRTSDPSDLLKYMTN